MKTFNAKEFKDQFPVFVQKVNTDLTYLDNAATTQKPQIVLDAITDFYLTKNANAHRASHPLAQKATESLENTRKKVAQYINAESEEVIFCKGTTEGINLLASTLSNKLKAGDEILLTSLEHHANYLPWLVLEEKLDITVKILPLHEEDQSIEQLPEYLNEKTKIISITGASNVLGKKVAIEKIKSLVKPYDPIIVVDGAQSIAHELIDVKALDVDFFVFSSHKLYGPTGIGIIFGKKQQLQTLVPWQLGGNMVKKIQGKKAVYAPPPYLFEAGTLPMAQIAGLYASLEFIEQYDHHELTQYENHLTGLFHDALSKIQDIRLITQPENNVGIVNFTFHSNSRAEKISDLGYWLDTHNVAVRTGKHCAHPLYQAMNIQSGVRISLAPYNLEEDVNRCLNLIEEWMRKTEVKKKERQQQLNHPQLITKEALAPLINVKGRQKYQALVNLGNQLIIHEAIELPQNEIQGCESTTWLNHWTEDRKHYFNIHSVSRVVNGLCFITLYLCQGKSTEEILKLDWNSILEELGLKSQLSLSRTNGFEAIISAVKAKLE